MSKFLFVYHAPPTPADAPEMSQEDLQAVMGRWMAWSEQVGDGMVDFGTPLANGARVTPDGTSDSTSDVTGYTILEAESREAALELAKSHPHLSEAGGCQIEVHEAQPIPGM